MIRIARTELTAVAALAALFVAAPVTAQSVDERASYSYVRTIEGRASLASAGRGPGEEADLNQPLLQGDTVRVERGARLEIALADLNLLRIAGDSTVNLVRVAFSADRDDRTTRLDLEEGEIVLVITDEALGDELPEIRTPAGRVFIHQPGTYRLRASAEGELELVVRSGFAELLTERGSTVVRTGEEAWTRGDRWGAVKIGDAGPLDALERWGQRLDQGAQLADSRTLHVEPRLAYSAAPLERHGTWVYVDSSWLWRPRVTADWRPYWNGRWGWTPSGLTWISAEPWGWLPYHYGTWTIATGHGWVWRPGRVYSPAWVYWYVGPRWTGWCPIGYYADFYRSHRRGGLRFGLYGWAGGSWGIYADWNFSPTHRVYDRHGGRHRRTGGHLRRTEGRGPRGLLTTDTRTADRRDWANGDGIVEKIGRGANARLGQLPVVTDFVARRPRLSAELTNVVTARKVADNRARIETPLGPMLSKRGGAKATTEADGLPAAKWRARPTTPAARSISARGRNAISTRPAPEARSSAASGRQARGRSEPAIGVRGRQARPTPEARSSAASGRQARGRSEPEIGVRERQARPAPATPRARPGAIPKIGDAGRERRDGDGLAAGSRQGWRRNAPSSPPRSASGTSGRRTTTRRSAPDEPVHRVIGGVRRGASDGSPSNASPRGRRPTTSDGLPASGARGRSKPQLSDPGIRRPAPRSTAPRSGASTGRAVPRSGGGSVRATPPKSGSRPSAGKPSVRPRGGKPTARSTKAKPPARGGASAKGGSTSKRSKSDPEPPARSRASRGKRGGGGGGG
jgi:hypothetical protein